MGLCVRACVCVLVELRRHVKDIQQELHTYILTHYQYSVCVLVVLHRHVEDIQQELHTYILTHDQYHICISHKVHACKRIY